jgi:hypothetical protein
VRQRVRSEEKRERARVLPFTMLGARVGVRALTTRPRVSCFSQPQTFVPSSVCQPNAPSTLARQRRVFVALSLRVRGVSRSAAVATVPPQQNKHDLWLPYAQRRRHGQDNRRSAPVRHSCHSVRGDNFRSTWTAMPRVLWPNTELPRSSAQHHQVAERRSAQPRSGSGVLLHPDGRPTTPSINNIASPTISRQQQDTNCLSTGHCRQSAAGLKSLVLEYASILEYGQATNPKNQKKQTSPLSCSRISVRVLVFLRCLRGNYFLV